MPSLRRGATGVICAAGLLSGACAAKAPKPLSDQAPLQAAVEAAPTPVVQTDADPIADLIRLSEEYVQTGEQHLREGRPDEARTAFNHARDVILESPGGPQATPELGAHFDRVVARLNEPELAVEAQAESFAPRAPEPAPIDNLLSIATLERPEPTAETEQAVADDLLSAAHDIEIPQNQRVLSFVELFTGRLRGYLQEGLGRGARYLPMIQDVFRAEGLPLDLAYVPLIESAFKPDALSRAKAMGMWQFMRGTALENGLSHDWYIDERADPEKATRAAAKYLKTLYSMFNDWHLALASYNGGPGRVQRAMKRSGRTDFWKLSASSRYLPQETRDYVPLILAAIVIARNPAQYEMEVAPLEAPPFETVTVAGAVDIRRIAEWGGTPVQQIQALNPELRRWTTPIRATEYELKVPVGAAASINARMAEEGLDDLAPLSHYTVKSGDTLLSIAKKLRVTRSDLAESNYLPTSARLEVGQQLIIPRPPALIDAVDETPARTSDVVLVSRVSNSPADDSADRSVTTHVVAPGETLTSIAKRYGTTVWSIKQRNGLHDDRIQAGQRLVIDRLSAFATN
jgi:membrane-bound lytic murein transglycosylase D